jgi:MoxR-like ATPase
MEERQVTIDNQAYPLPKPFLVLATQNPVEMESTFKLPAAQLDRFFIKLSLGYPKPEEEAAMLANLGDRIPFEKVEAVTGREEILDAQKRAQQVYLSDDVAKYIVAVVTATRNHGDLVMGASPRGSRALYKAAKVWAAMEGRDFVTPDDVKKVAVPVLCHRMVLSAEARYAGQTGQRIIEEILEETRVGADSQEIIHEL